MNSDRKKTLGQGSTGLSLVELLLVLAIMAILTGTGLVYMNTDGYRLRAEANNLKSTLQEARMEAVKRNESVRVVLDPEWYRVEMANDSTIGNLNNIRKIRFWLLGRSKDSVPGAGQQNLEVVVDKDSLADDGICIENVDSNKCVVYRVPSVDEDGRIRMLSRGDVVLRNVVLN